MVQVFKAINLKNPEWLGEDNDLVGGVSLRGEPASGEGVEQSFRPHGEAQGLPRALCGEGTSIGGLQFGNLHSLLPSTRRVPGNVALCSHKNRDAPGVILPGREASGHSQPTSEGSRCSRETVGT